MVTQSDTTEDEIAQEILRRYRQAERVNEPDELAQRILEQYRAAEGPARLRSPVAAPEEISPKPDTTPARNKQGMARQIGRAALRAPILPTGLSLEQFLRALDEAQKPFQALTQFARPGLTQTGIPLAPSPSKVPSPPGASRYQQLYEAERQESLLSQILAGLITDPTIFVGPGALRAGARGVEAAARGLGRTGAGVREAVPLARPLRTAAAGEPASTGWLARRPLPQGVPPSASNLAVYKVKEAIAAGEAIPRNVWESLGPSGKTYQQWASGKTEAEILSGVRPPSQQVGVIQPGMDIGERPAQGELGLGGRIGTQEPVPLIDAQQVAERQRLAAETTAGQLPLQGTTPIESVPSKPRLVETAEMAQQSRRTFQEVSGELTSRLDDLEGWQLRQADLKNKLELQGASFDARGAPRLSSRASDAAFRDLTNYNETVVQVRFKRNIIEQLQAKLESIINPSAEVRIPTPLRTTEVSTATEPIPSTSVIEAAPQAREIPGGIGATIETAPLEDVVPTPIASELGSALEEARLRLDEARAMRDAELAPGLPAPRFGTREAAEVDAARRQASAEGHRFIPKKERVRQARQQVRDAEQAVLKLQEADKQEFVAANAPDPISKVPPPPPELPTATGQAPPVGPRGPGPLGISFPSEIPPLKGRVQAGQFAWERPDEVALQLHFAAIANEERRANILTREGTESLRGLGMGRLIRGQWAPRPEDLSRLDSLNEALHAPSQVEQGLIRVPEGLEERYQELRGLMDWESAATLDFDPNMARIQDYWYRGWKPPEGMFIQQRGQLVRNPSFRMPRSEATYQEMRELGFEPLSWNPYEQWKIRRIQGVKYRQQVDLVEVLKGMGEDMIKPHAGGPTPEGWRTPRIGPAFEGKPFAFADPVSGDPMIGFTKRWIVRDVMANGLENAYGIPPNLGKIMLGERAVDVKTVIDGLTFVPKRFKLVGSFFQPFDFLVRSGTGSWGAMTNALRTGHPVEAVQHMASYPPAAIDILRSFVSPQWRETIIRRLDDTTPLVKERPGITTKSVSEAGLNIYDPTTFGQNPLELDSVIREALEEGLARKAIKSIPRAFLELERITRQGLFGGVYPAAMINDVQHNIGPQMIRTYGKEWNDAQLSRNIALSANMAYSSMPATQSVVQNRFVRETLTRVAFSLNESEGLLRQATNALPFGFRFSNKGIPVLTRGGHLQKFWLDRWLGTYLFLVATASIIHFASTGQPLPRKRFTPIAADKWGPLPFGYNMEFAAPDLPLEGQGGSRIMLDLVGQMDTAFKVLDPAGFVAARQSVPIRAFKNQVEAQDFYKKPIDEEGPGGVYSRTTHLIQDMFAPIGAGQAGLNILAQKVPEAEPFVSFGERKLGTGGQLIQAGGVNVRAETIDTGLRRRHPYYDLLAPATQEELREQLILEVFGPKTRRDKERFEEKKWELFPPTQEQRRRFKQKMDREFGGSRREFGETQGQQLPGFYMRGR